MCDLSVKSYISPLFLSALCVGPSLRDSHKLLLPSPDSHGYRHPHAICPSQPLEELRAPLKSFEEKLEFVIIHRRNGAVGTRFRQRNIYLSH